MKITREIYKIGDSMIENIKKYKLNNNEQLKQTIIKQFNEIKKLNNDSYKIRLEIYDDNIENLNQDESFILYQKNIGIYTSHFNSIK